MHTCQLRHSFICHLPLCRRDPWLVYPTCPSCTSPMLCSLGHSLPMESNYSCRAGDLGLAVLQCSLKSCLTGQSCKRKRMFGARPAKIANPKSNSHDGKRKHVIFYHRNNWKWCKLRYLCTPTWVAVDEALSCIPPCPRAEPVAMLQLFSWKEAHAWQCWKIMKVVLPVLCSAMPASGMQA